MHIYAQSMHNCDVEQLSRSVKSAGIQHTCALTQYFQVIINIKLLLLLYKK